ncbi:hypothetical protein Cma02nite_16850 [Cellulomonas marina]|nr:hypothetical protein Cma02nite_16850 [Cellulomonas marina]
MWEDEDLGPDDEAATGTAARGARRRWPGTWGRRLLVVATVLAVGTWAVVDRVEERREAARLAAVDGLSVTLAAPLVPAWQVPGDVVAGSGDGVVLLAARTDGATTAVDLRTGEVLFTERARCRFPDGEEAAAVEDDAAGGPALVVCVQGPTSRVGGTTVTVREARTGALVRDVAWDARSPVVATAGLLVAVLPEPAGQTTVTASSVRTGEPRWSFVLAGTTTPGSAGVGPAAGSTIPLLTPTGTVSLDVRTGRPVPGLRGARPLPAGGLARPDQDGAAMTTTVLDDEGDPRFTVPGTVLAVTVDDGTGGHVLHTVRRSPDSDGLVLTTVDAGTGDVRWTAAPPAMTPSPPAVLDGRVLVPTLRGVVALDAATGATAWALPTTAGPGQVDGMATDGRRVLQVEPDPGGRPLLVARDVRDGTVVWTAAPPPSDAPAAPLTTSVLADGSVLVTGGGRVTRLVVPER